MILSSSSECLKVQILRVLEQTGDIRAGFYGVISLHFQNGNLTLIRREETFRPNHEERTSHEKKQARTQP
jgi:hypothetical protein